MHDKPQALASTTIKHYGSTSSPGLVHTGQQYAKLLHDAATFATCSCNPRAIATMPRGFW
jgi:hypothetical protein